MAKHFNETVRNGERYYERANHNYTAKMMDGEGFTARIDSSDRTYFVITRIDEGAELVIMEISPSIHCPKEARSQVGEYIDKINARYKCCNLRIAPNGNLHIHAEQRFDDAPLSVEMFKIMEGECIKILDTFEVVLEKLAHMKLLDPDEADVEKVIKKHIEKIKMKLAEDLSEDFSFDDNEDDEDEEPDEEYLPKCPKIPEPPGFSEWLRRRTANGNPFARRPLEEKETESSIEDSNEVASGTLLDELLSITEDESEGNNTESTVNNVDGENTSS